MPFQLQMPTILTGLFTFSTLFLAAQIPNSETGDALREHTVAIRENIESMRFLTDSPEILDKINQLDSMNYQVENVVASVFSDGTGVEDSLAWMEEEMMEAEAVLEEVDMDLDAYSNEQKEEDIQVSDFVPFKKKSDTGLRIQSGINSIYKGSNPVPGFLDPKINTGASWFWDLGLIKKVRLGGKESRTALLFGVSWLINRYSFQNDAVLAENLANGPEFVKLDNVNKHPKLNVGYVTVPVSFRFSLSKKLRVELGGYAGYRLHSVQKTSYKSGDDIIQSQRYSDFQLNNWLYGASAGINLAGFNIVGRYSLSGLFNENPTYNFTTFMLGTSITLF